MAMDKEERYMALASQRRSGVLRPIIASLQVKTYRSLLPHSGEVFRLRDEKLMTLRYQLMMQTVVHISDNAIKNCSQAQVAKASLRCLHKLLRPDRLDTDPNSSTAAKEWTHWIKTFEILNSCCFL